MGTALDANLNVSVAQTITGTALSTYSVDQQSILRHSENGVPVGIGVFPSAFTANSSDTVEFQAVSATDAALTGTLTVLATTGALANTDTRFNPVAVEASAAVAGVAGGKGIFLTIPPGSLVQRYVGLKVIAAGNSITLNAFVMPLSGWSQMVLHAANYTP